MYIARPKVLFDPLCGVVDIRSVVPMVDHPRFQILRDRKQLSLSEIAFPAARHSRFEHSIGSFAATRRLADRWLLLGIIDRDMRQALKGYALYHDIGHAAFSHVTEDFCGDHNVRTRAIVAQLRETIEKCDINFDLMLSLIKRENPLHAAVSDKNVGIEKLDYLERDGWYTGVGCPSGVKYLRKFMYFADGHVAIDEKMVEHVQDTLRFYMQMYKDVYLRKSLVIAQRMFHKMLFYAIMQGDIRPEMLPELTDSELLGRLSLVREPRVRGLFERFRSRSLLKEAVVFRSFEHIRETRTVTKKICVVGVMKDDMETMSCSKVLTKANHAGLELIESLIAGILGIDQHEVVVVPPIYADRFVAKDVMIYGNEGRLHSLRQRRPVAFESMVETARAYAAVRVCVPEAYREIAPSKIQKIQQLLLAN